MSKFLHVDDDADDAKVIAIPRIFSKTAMLIKPCSLSPVPIYNKLCHTSTKA